MKERIKNERTKVKVLGGALNLVKRSYRAMVHSAISLAVDEYVDTGSEDLESLGVLGDMNLFTQVIKRKKQRKNQIGNN